MNPAISPLGIAQVVARNLVPLVGILAFRWSAGNVLVLYLLDTLLAMTVILAGLMSHMLPPPEDEGVGGWLNAEAGYLLFAALVAAIIGIPLGMPIGIVLAANDFSFSEVFQDHSVRIGALVQAVMALLSYIELYGALKRYSPAQLQLRKRFALVFLRWVAVVIATYFLANFLFVGSFVLLVLVAVYAGASTFAELAPDRFLRYMPGGAEDAALRVAVAARERGANSIAGSMSAFGQKRTSLVIADCGHSIGTPTLTNFCFGELLS